MAVTAGRTLAGRPSLGLVMWAQPKICKNFVLESRNGLNILIMSMTSLGLHHWTTAQKAQLIQTMDLTNTYSINLYEFCFAKLTQNSLLLIFKTSNYCCCYIVISLIQKINI